MKEKSASDGHLCFSSALNDVNYVAFIEVCELVVHQNKSEKLIGVLFCIFIYITLDYCYELFTRHDIRFRFLIKKPLVTS